MCVTDGGEGVVDLIPRVFVGFVGGAKTMCTYCSVVLWLSARPHGKKLFNRE